MNRYQGRHNMKWGGEMRAYYGEAARFEPINLVFNSALTANSSDTPRRRPAPATSGRRSCSARSTTRPRRASCRCRSRTCVATPRTSRTTGTLNDRLTLNVGLRWEYEPGADGSAEPALAAARSDVADSGDAGARRPPIPAQARAADGAARATATASTAHGCSRARAIRTRGTARRANFLPRFGVDLSARRQVRWSRVGYARYPDADRATCATRSVTSSNQHTGFAQTTTTLGLANGVPRQTLAESVSRPTTR